MESNDTDENILSKANSLVERLLIMKFEKFESIDQLKVAAFTGLFVVIFRSICKDDVDGVISNPTSKRENTENLLRTLKILGKEYDVGADHINCYEIMRGNIHHIDLMLNLLVKVIDMERCDFCLFNINLFLSKD